MPHLEGRSLIVSHIQDREQKEFVVEPSVSSRCNIHQENLPITSHKLQPVL